MERPLTTPVLLCIFNRPKLTERVFAAIRQYQPRELLIASDGPRESHPDDAVNVAAAREIAQRVDWECEVKPASFRKTLAASRPWPRRSAGPLSKTSS